MTTIMDKYDHQLLNSKGTKKEDNVAFYLHEGSSKDRKGGSKKDVECYNCHKKGHYKVDCWAEGGGKEGQGPKSKGKVKGKPKAAVAAVAAKEKEEEKVEAWMVLLAVVDEPEESFDEEMDIPESQSYLDENFDKELTITDNLSDKIEYVPIKEEAYVTTYELTVL